MPHHQYKGYGDLKIKLDNPSDAIYPGFTVRGRVIRKWSISTGVTLRVRLLGRAKAKFATDDHGFLGVAKKVRLRHSFWKPDDVSQVLHDGWLRIRPGDEPKSWAFALQLLRTTKSVYSCKDIDEKTFEGFVEYWLEAVMEEESRVEATLPLRVYARPSPVVISDFMFRLSSIRSMVPSDEQVQKTCSGVPYDLHVERPSILQFGAAIPFRIRLMPRYNSDDHSDTDFPKAKPPEWYLRDDEAICRGTPGKIGVPTGPQDKPVDVGKALGLKFSTWGKLEGKPLPRPRRSRAVERVVTEFATNFLKTKNALCFKLQLSIDRNTVRFYNSFPVELVPCAFKDAPIAPQPSPQPTEGVADAVPRQANGVKEPARQPPPSPPETPAKHDDAVGDVLPVRGVASSSGTENHLQLLVAAIREART
ncbi:hypothetical protein CSOJ01_15065 [Colletotrichum sojae]|uniref:Arrestin-like N-terminal domain-containing protein n=1 Tax=Colletotrichum sojae TaxID=2175907 RepID=A0A8H6IPE0_9PEZI|nr:hypothetical protein CSOJ01_15065 [Colletotrichum sojae]